MVFQVAQPATDVVQIRGGTTYFNPEIQPYNQGWSPARRVKVAIPIVNPQVNSYFMNSIANHYLYVN